MPLNVVFGLEVWHKTEKCKKANKICKLPGHQFREMAIELGNEDIDFGNKFGGILLIMVG